MILNKNGDPGGWEIPLQAAGKVKTAPAYLGSLTPLIPILPGRMRRKKQTDQTKQRIRMLLIPIPSGRMRRKKQTDQTKQKIRMRRIKRAESMIQPTRMLRMEQIIQAERIRLPERIPANCRTAAPVINSTIRQQKKIRERCMDWLMTV